MNAHASIIVTDLGLVWVGWFFANLIRFSGLPVGTNLAGFVMGSWLLPPVVVGGMLIGGCYRHPVRLFFLQDSLRLARTVPLAWMIGFLMLIGISYRYLSLYLIPVGALVLLPLLAAPRLWNRVRWEKRAKIGPKNRQNVLIYGVIDKGPALAGWVQTVSYLNLLGFLDDDPEFREKLICGFPVLGRESDIPTIHAVHGVNEIWVIFVPERKKRARLEQVCDKLDIRLVIVPQLEPFSAERLLEWEIVTQSVQNVKELWHKIEREIEALDFDYAAFYLNARGPSRVLDVHSTASRGAIGSERRKTPLLFTSVSQRNQEPQWTWTRQSNETNDDIGSRRFLRLALPLLDKDNQNIGNLLVLRDLEHSSLRAEDLHHLIYLQSIFTSALSKIMNQKYL